MPNIFCNTRNLHAAFTGVQRHTQALCAELGTAITPVQPAQPLSGLKGHVWEQRQLRHLVGDQLLWSPANTGPLNVPRQVVTIHDTLAFDHPEWLSRRFAQWYRWLTPRLAKRAAHIIAVSNFTKQQIQHHCGISGDKISVIPNGIDAIFTPQSPAQISAMHHALQLPSRRYLLSVGALQPRKNLLNLLHAWRQLLPMLDDELWLVLTGAAGAAHVFARQNLGALPPRVHFTGHVSDTHLPALYAGAHGFAFLSHYEGFGLPPLEAMACGTPVLVSNSSALPESVGAAALQADPNNIDDISQQLHTLIYDNDQRQTLQQHGQEHASQFTWAHAATQTLNLLRAH